MTNKIVGDFLRSFSTDTSCQQRIERPQTVSAAAKRVAQGAVVLAGGSIVVNWLCMRGSSDLVVDISGLRELTEIDHGKLRCRLGALTTVADLIGLGGEDLTAIRQAAGEFGNAHLRRLATVGGNIAWLKGNADLLTPLMALDARAEIATDDGMEFVDVGQMRERVRFAPVLITQIEIPRSPDARSAFAKLALRRASAPSIATAAVYAGLNHDQLHKVRVVVGGVRSDPQRVPAAEVELEGRTLNLDTTERAARAVGDRVAVDPELDKSESAYRRSVAAAAMRRALDRLSATA